MSWSTCPTCGESLVEITTLGSPRRRYMCHNGHQYEDENVYVERAYANYEVRPNRTGELRSEREWEIGEIGEAGGARFKVLREATEEEWASVDLTVDPVIIHAFQYIPPQVGPIRFYEVSCD